MISLIVCSRHQQPLSSFVQNIEETIGAAYELVHVDNSANKYSIFEAYNIGFEKSKGNILCYVHEDVYFHSYNWGENLIQHLSQPNVGIVGFAGGGRVTQIPDSWKNKRAAIHIIQSDKNKSITRKVTLPTNYNATRKEVILLDGVFLAMNRNVASKIRFDESLGGFHSYDLDISLQAYHAGFRNYVMYNIDIEHFSRGFRDKRYFENLLRLFTKWQEILPVYLVDEQPATYIDDSRNLFRLLYKLVSRGFNKLVVVSQITTFAKRSKSVSMLQNAAVVSALFNVLSLFSKRK